MRSLRQDRRRRSWFRISLVIDFRRGTAAHPKNFVVAADFGIIAPADQRDDSDEVQGADQHGVAPERKVPQFHGIVAVFVAIPTLLMSAR